MVWLVNFDKIIGTWRDEIWPDNWTAVTQVWNSFCAMYSNPKQLSVNEMVLPSEEPQALDNDRNMCLDNGSLLYMSPVIVTIWILLTDLKKKLVTAHLCHLNTGDDFNMFSLQDGKRSAQFEQTLLVTETGCDILTIRPDDNGRPHFLSQM